VILLQRPMLPDKLRNLVPRAFLNCCDNMTPDRNSMVTQTANLQTHSDPPAAAKHYRRDIDGLRAIAVVAVVLFHFGLLSSGYLGVDVFFVISGYLLTTIILAQQQRGRFSFADFYLRRARRILPLSFVVCFVTMAVGAVTMLPDDLENLAASVVATNVFANNVLQAITTRNYWDVVNEYKPLLHTWSLGVEEQYYLIYPLFLTWAAQRRQSFLVAALAVATALSLSFYMLPVAPHIKFYWLPFRFFEMAAGGMVSILTNAIPRRHSFCPPLLIALFTLLLFGVHLVPPVIATLLVVAVSAALVASEGHANFLVRQVLENNLAVGLGLISYSIYMWHQPVLAFSRYCLFPHLRLLELSGISLVILFLSMLTYRFVELPFRDPVRVPTGRFLVALGFAFALSMSMAGFLYVRSGVIRDVPELGITSAVAGGLDHSAYNSRVYGYDRPFKDDSRVRVLVVGNSFARDWANVLLESVWADRINLSYVYDPANHPDFLRRGAEASVIFASALERGEVARLGCDLDKVYVVGTKNFGASSGIFYNYRGPDYCLQRTEMISGVATLEKKLAGQWGDRYISLIAAVIDQHRTVPVFTQDCKFISVDCRHFTEAGAGMFARILAHRIGLILGDAVGAGNAAAELKEIQP
jgi:peptidoglycan/LPS O-acetylase OafA/YrhL